MYQASKEGRGLSQPLNLPTEVKNHPDFNKNHRKFFGIDKADTASEWNRNVNKFFNAAGQEKPKNATATLGEKFINVQTNVEVNPNSELY